MYLGDLLFFVHFHRRRHSANTFQLSGKTPEAISPWIFKVKLYLGNGRPNCHGTKGTGVNRMPSCETLRKWINWTLHWLGYFWPIPFTLKFEGQITLTPYMVLPLFATRFAAYAGGHPSLFRTATSLLIWYKMFCMRDISYRLIWMKFINMFSVYAQFGTHRRFNPWTIAVLI